VGRIGCKKLQSRRWETGFWGRERSLCFNQKVHLVVQAKEGKGNLQTKGRQEILPVAVTETDFIGKTCWLGGK